MTLATGGSKTEAAGAGLGSVTGGALGSLAGPLGTVAWVNCRRLDRAEAGRAVQ